jgi:hypothetical protein
MTSESCARICSRQWGIAAQFGHARQKRDARTLEADAEILEIIRVRDIGGIDQQPRARLQPGDVLPFEQTARFAPSGIVEQVFGVENAAAGYSER